MHVPSKLARGRSTASIAIALLLSACSLPHVSIPERRERPTELVLLDQGWTGEQRQEFHHTSQGTRLLPYDWFMALEQPCLTPGDCGAFADIDYLSRFGFLPSTADPKLNPDALPIGFARESAFIDPVSGESYTALGLTCAACHTGELHWDKYAVRIEGGPGVIELGQFQKAIGIALGLTDSFPFSLWRWKRFEQKVLGEEASDAAGAKLKESVAAFVKEAKAAKEETLDAYRETYEAGFSRTDALARIGNMVFAMDMQNPANLAPATAPVRFPQVWDASWFDWVQYNSSISGPLVRNIGEALGVRAGLKLYGDDAGEYRNSVNVRGLKTLEDLLAGSAPFNLSDSPVKGLSSPKWPSVFPPLDGDKIAKGAALYGEMCERCHGPSVETLKEDYAAEQPRRWRENSQGQRLLKLATLPLEVIGTDPRQAENFAQRTADTGALGKGTVSAAEGLELVTRSIADRFFSENAFDRQTQLVWSGMRDPDEDMVRDVLVYKARPLNGVWAIAPYLHNGSVPNLYLLLSPLEERPRSFYTGSRQFDPVHVGYEYEQAFDGAYRMETDNSERPGNLNSGHRFEGDGSGGKGVIGRSLSESERFELIEYLKSI